jgi:hypothetical protein
VRFFFRYIFGAARLLFARIVGYMRKFTVRLLLLLFLSAPGLPARGATIRRLNLDALIARSQIVVHARVTGTRPYWDEETGTIWTATELQVLDAAKGSSGRSLIVKEPGGELGKVGHLFPGVPKFAVGDEVVVFLYSGPGNRLRVTGLHQGVYAVATDRDTGRSFVRPAGARHAEAVYERGSRPSPQLLSADEYRLADFLQSVRQRVR